MARKYTVQLDVQPTYNASATMTGCPLALPTAGVITRVSLYWDISLNVASTASFNADAAAKSTWTLLTLSGNSMQYVNISDPVLLMVHERMRPFMPAVYIEPTSTTVNATFVLRFRQTLHFGSHPMDPFDLTGGIIGPDHSKGGLLLSMSSPANSVAGSAVTINTATLARAECNVVELPDLDQQRSHIGVPTFYEADHAFANDTGQAKGYNTKVDLPVGQYLRDATVYMRDNGSGSTWAGDDTRINQIGIFGSGAAQRIIYAEDWYAAKMRAHGQSGKESQLGNALAVGANAGFNFYDFRHVANTAADPNSSTWGVNLTQEPLSAYQFGFSVGTPSNDGQAEFLFSQLKPAA